MSANRLPRWIPILAGIALPLLYPSIFVLSFYFNSAAYLNALPSVVEGVRDTADILTRFKFVCSEQAKAPDQLTSNRIADLNGDLSEKSDRFSGLWSDEGRYVVQRPWKLTEGLRNIIDADNEMLSNLSDEPHSRDLCSFEKRTKTSAGRDSVPVSQEDLEKAISAHLVERAEKLRGFAKRYEDGFQKYKPYRWIVATIAWTDLLLETAGAIGIVLMIRHSSRLRKARRGAKESGR